MYFHTKVDHDMHSKVLERTMNVFKKKKREINKNGNDYVAFYDWFSVNRREILSIVY